MKCPFCNYKESKVIDSRPTEEGISIRRRRECISCNRRFTTYEKVENIPIMVVKKDKSRQAFDREKLMDGLMRASVKRPISLSKLEEIIDDIEFTILNSLEREITSKKIGELVMEKLRKLDEVAYVRFASVYKQFRDIDTFLKELKSLLK